MWSRGPRTPDVSAEGTCANQASSQWFCLSASFLRVLGTVAARFLALRMQIPHVQGCCGEQPCCVHNAWRTGTPSGRCCSYSSGHSFIKHLSPDCTPGPHDSVLGSHRLRTSALGAMPYYSLKLSGELALEHVQPLPSGPPPPSTATIYNPRF